MLDLIKSFPFSGFAGLWSGLCSHVLNNQKHSNFVMWRFPEFKEVFRRETFLGVSDLVQQVRRQGIET